MKRVVYTLSLFLLFTFITSCEKNDNEGGFMEPVTEVQATPGYGAVYFSWKNPANANFYYVNIEYTDSNGNIRKKKVCRFDIDESADLTRGNIFGFTDQNAYTFTLTACGYSGERSNPVTVSATPWEPAYNIVLRTVNILADYGGVIVKWGNDTEVPLNIKVEYQNGSGSKITKLFNAEEPGEAYIQGLSAVAATFRITVVDELKNSSEERYIEVTPLEEKQLSKSTWSIAGFSSQEPAESPNGFAHCVFDNNTGTFWHSAWAGSQPGYPHWFSVDMGDVQTISRVVCYRRQGDGRGQTRFAFFTSMDGITWEDQGTFDFNPHTDEGQSFRIASTQARYFRYVATQGPNFFAFLSEITLFGGE